VKRRILIADYPVGIHVGGLRDIAVSPPFSPMGIPASKFVKHDVRAAVLGDVDPVQEGAP
jgi:hypothetical protein